MRHGLVKTDDTFMDFSSLSDENQIALSLYNALRRDLYNELEKLEGAKAIFAKYNVFFIEACDSLNRINIDAPKEV